MSAIRLTLAASAVLFAVALLGAGDGSCVPVPQESYCVYDGVQYEPGESFPATDGCNTCVCGEDGTVACTLMACGCLYDDQWYGYGESFPATDGCNTCTCTPDGILCTLMYCGCLYEGEFYGVGESFPAADDCNTCTCVSAGQIACTEMYCPPDCDPEAEWWRDYLGTPETCPVIHFVCPGDANYFTNACGCGCEQPEDCPQWFNCMPGPGTPACDVDWIHEHCPYSGIAW